MAADGVLKITEWPVLGIAEESPTPLREPQRPTG